jgi:hypothetical protein
MATVNQVGPQIKGWKVYAGKEVKLRENVKVVRWKAISKMFTVRSAADEFCRLAEKQYGNVQVQAEYAR